MSGSETSMETRPATTDTNWARWLGVPLPVASDPTASASGGHRKISMNLSLSDYTGLRAWADEEGTSVSDIIRRALMLLRHLSYEQARGSRILIETPENETNQVLRELKTTSQLTMAADSTGAP